MATAIMKQKEIPEMDDAVSYTHLEIVPEVWIGIHQNYWKWQHIH